ncbi:unnamed protein product [Acanthoscelides obtectus]|uniref:Uncharacterized protein n=1 Tax=Acanthoscelides obtectus TaxID=200917 RepID=A0A9P0KMC7_ACAOB|nr:unnamed protein product [Acanthoscelides obtectus]CAK1681657.1 hypothetical protein AOBTE_LOCUS33195 [Acanthoscelides obtectus]
MCRKKVTSYVAEPRTRHRSHQWRIIIIYHV